MAVVDRHQGTGVVEFSTVVRGAEYSDKLTATEELVAILNYLMGSADKIYVILFEEALDDGLTEGIADTTVVLSPAGLASFGVGPQQVAHQTVLRDLSGSG